MARGTNIRMDPNPHVIIAFSPGSYAEFEQAMARGNRSLSKPSYGTVILTPLFEQDIKEVTYTSTEAYMTYLQDKNTTDL